METGAICILAYPEEFVSMIPAWYRKPMEWAGMVNDGKICVGHAAMALIEKKTGDIHYADFGRYITPFGYGRTRMENTDPDVHFDYKVKFDEKGEILDKIELFKHFYKHPEKTHGGDTMFVSLNQEIDFDACYKFITDMNAKGSIIYDPFGKGRSNCSRFVFDAILAGMKNNKDRRRLRLKSPITASPLANVFHGTNEESYEFTPEGYSVVKDKSIKKIVTYFFKKPNDNSIIKDDFEPLPDMFFLGGVGDQAYFHIEKIVENDHAVVSKLDSKGNKTFTHRYKPHPQFNANLDFSLIHDCNAAWLTILQGDKKLRFDRIY